MEWSLWSESLSATSSCCFDFIEERREHGAPLEEALLDAGIQRLRPVMITVAATVLALYPLASHGGPLWEPLCYAQIGGLSIATFITLGLVPVLYAIAVKDLKWIAWSSSAAEDSLREFPVAAGGVKFVERKRLTRQESRLVTHAMLVDAAEEVFLREGFEHASVEQITEAAGFSRGAFYSNFNDKDDLALAVIDKRRRDVAKALKTFQRISDPEQQRAALRNWFSKQWQERDWIALQVEFNRRATRNPVLEARLAELCRQEIQTWAGSVARSFSSDGSLPAVTALALIATCRGLGSVAFHAAPDLDQLCKAAVSLVFDRVAGG